jgi:phosphoglucosamine mutase
VQKLFGTDGIRGIANKTLTCETAYKVGKALAQIYSTELEKIKIVVGKDTRKSCDMLQAALISGIMAMGASVELVGIMPSGGVAYLAKKLKAHAGVVITASHNEASYNGIKIFNGNGYKLTTMQELQIEQLVFEDSSELVKNEKIGQININKKASEAYIKYLIGDLEGFFSGISVCLDCANGAGSVLAPKIFKKLGVNLTVINNKRDGISINEKCGATDLNSLIKKLKSEKCDIGFALDGDADRLMTVDEKGKTVDADNLIYLLAKDLKQKNKLNGNSAVGTIMSNYGLELMLKEENISLKRTQVGDKYIVDFMLENSLNFGGEQSGHFVFKNYVTTADGIASAIQILKLLKQQEKPISELFKSVKKLPQILLNIKVDEDKKQAIISNPELLAKIKQCEKQLENIGRVVIRASGTENVIRIMVEGKNENLVKNIAKTLKNVVISL